MLVLIRRNLIHHNTKYRASWILLSIYWCMAWYKKENSISVKNTLMVVN